MIFCLELGVKTSPLLLENDREEGFIERGGAIICVLPPFLKGKGCCLNGIYASVGVYGFDFLAPRVAKATS